MLMVPGDFSEDLEEELWSLTKQREETVQALSHRLKELVLLIAKLITNAEIILKVQQCRFFNRARPMDCQDKLASAGDHYDKPTAIFLYSKSLERSENVTS
uniref:Uncharacterized protein n=1 Tax=Peronospora matthiolae TaxID=2874970 RepID=A0AAV1UUJ0_9STRA